MAFKKVTEQRKTPLTSLIDIIFLLLIFYLVASFGGLAEEREAAEEIGKPELAEDLPRPVATITPEPNKPFPHLLIQIQKVERVTPFNDSLEFYLLDETVKTVDEARSDTSNIYFGIHGDYRARRGPHPFQKSNGEIISGAIKKIADRINYIRNTIDPYPEVEVRAYKGTKFGSLAKIFELCREKEISEIKFWVLKGRAKATSEE